MLLLTTLSFSPVRFTQLCSRRHVHTHTHTPIFARCLWKTSLTAPVVSGWRTHNLFSSCSDCSPTPLPFELSNPGSNPFPFTTQSPSGPPSTHRHSECPFPGHAGRTSSCLGSGHGGLPIVQLREATLRTGFVFPGRWIAGYLLTMSHPLSTNHQQPPDPPPLPYTTGPF